MCINSVWAAAAAASPLSLFRMQFSKANKIILMYSFEIVTNLPYHIEYPRARLLINNVNNGISLQIWVVWFIINQVTVSFGEKIYLFRDIDFKIFR